VRYRIFPSKTYILGDGGGRSNRFDDEIFEDDVKISRAETGAAEERSA
jgi:hypothetical protein